jgi:hypothetical protein
MKNFKLIESVNNIKLIDGKPENVHFNHPRGFYSARLRISELDDGAMLRVTLGDGSGIYVPSELKETWVCIDPSHFENFNLLNMKVRTIKRPIDIDGDGNFETIVSDKFARLDSVDFFSLEV